MQYNLLKLLMDDSTKYKDKDVMDIEIPDDVSQIGLDAMRAIWLVAEQKIKNQLEKQAQDAHDKQQQAEHAYDKLKEKNLEVEQRHKHLKLELEQLQREKKRIVTDLERLNGEIGNQKRHYDRLEEKLLEREQEIRHLGNEFSRTNESSIRLQKLLDDKNRQYELLQQEEREHHEALAIAKRNQERLQDDLKQLSNELDQTREKNKKDYAEALSNKILVNELREYNKKQEHELQQLRSELQDSKERFENEHNLRIKLEKKTDLQISQLESANEVNRNTIKKIEQDLTMAQSETTNLRNRMIRVDGAMERDKKEIERLEAHLVSLVGDDKKNYTP